jgi:hypothetical protein
MNESFSPVIFLYGMALVLGVSKACTQLIWRTLARPRPGLRQELRDAWLDRNRTQPASLKPRPQSQAPGLEATTPDRVPEAEAEHTSLIRFRYGAS